MCKYYISNNIHFIQGYGNLVETPSSATHMKETDAREYVSYHPDHVVMKYGNNKKKRNYVVSTKQRFIGQNGSIVNSMGSARYFNSPEAAFEYLDNILAIKDSITEPFVIDDRFKKMKRPTQTPQIQKAVAEGSADRVRFTPDTYKIVVKNYNGICPLCGKPLSEKEATIDHIVPLSRGGTNDVGNLRPVHFECNQLKGSFLDNEMYRTMGNITSNYVYNEPDSIFLDALIRSMVRGKIAKYHDDVKKLVRTKLAVR